jgi:hypothetical protein
MSQEELITTKILQLKEFFLGRGIDPIEAERAAIAYYSEPEPPIALPWPPALLGVEDLMPQITPLVPDTGTPPYFQPNTHGTTEPYPTFPTPDPLGAVKTNNPKYNQSGSNVGHTYQIENTVAQGDQTNWLGLQTHIPAQPPTLNVIPWNVQQSVQPWKYNIEDPGINPNIPNIAIYPSGMLNETKLKKIQEVIAEVRQEFAWMSDDYLMRAKQLADNATGRLYLVRASQEAITDHRSEGEPYRRLLAGDELLGMARTAIGHGMDINHNPDWRTQAIILDSEYDPMTKSIQMLILETDPEINRLIDGGQITAVSINGGSPRHESIEPCLHGCNDGNCELCVVPRGVVLGEQDDIGLTWVVTDPRGMMWHGQFIEGAEPGVKTTIIQPV